MRSCCGPGSRWEPTGGRSRRRPRPVHIAIAAGRSRQGRSADPLAYGPVRAFGYGARRYAGAEIGAVNVSVSDGPIRRRSSSARRGRHPRLGPRRTRRPAARQRPGLRTRPHRRHHTPAHTRPAPDRRPGPRTRPDAERDVTDAGKRHRRSETAPVRRSKPTSSCIPKGGSAGTRRSSTVIGGVVRWVSPQSHLELPRVRWRHRRPRRIPTNMAAARKHLEEPLERATRRQHQVQRGGVPAPVRRSGPPPRDGGGGANAVSG